MRESKVARDAGITSLSWVGVGSERRAVAMRAAAACVVNRIDVEPHTDCGEGGQARERPQEERGGHWGEGASHGSPRKGLPRHGAGVRHPRA